MRKSFRYFAAMWAAMLAAFNVVTFCVQALPGYAIVYDARFWISWSLVILSYVCQLLFAWYAFQEKNNGKFFLNLSLIKLSYGGVILMTLAAAACMLIPDCPAWVAAVCCYVILAGNVIAGFKAMAAAELVSKREDEVKSAVLFTKALTTDAQTLMARAETEEIRAQCKKVWEAVRYADPMSNRALADEERQIRFQFAQVAQAVQENDLEAVQAQVRQFEILMENRNNKCKQLK